MNQLEKIEQLEEEVTYLRSLIFGPEQLARELSWTFSLTQAQGAVLACIFTASVGTKEACYNALYFNRPDDTPEPKIIDVLICRIRKKLKLFEIEVQTLWGRGYYFTPENKEKVKTAIEEKKATIQPYFRHETKVQA